MAKKEKKTEAIVIKPPNFKRIEFTVTGIAPLMQARFSEKARQKMHADMEAGSTAKTKKKREPRDFKADFEGAMHKSTEGWIGVPASAFRNACIDVCRMTGFKMTHAKMSIFVEHDGLDKVDGHPLVKLQAGKPEYTEMPVPNANGRTDLRVRPMWREWAVKLRIRFDADQFTSNDVANLLERAGMQVGIGEGRPYSKMSNGMGYGMFTIKSKKEAA